MSTYTPITWSNGDAVTVQRLNQMSGNDQFLYDNLTQAKHIDHGGREKTSGVKIWAKTDRMPATAGTRSVLSVSFGGFFSPGCVPVISATLGRRDRNHVFVSVKGPGDNNWPTNRGCQIHALVSPTESYRFTIFMPIHIIAIGY